MDVCWNDELQWLFCGFQFIYPMPRNDGFEFILMQFDGKDVQFTPLAMYQVQRALQKMQLQPQNQVEKGSVCVNK